MKCPIFKNAATLPNSKNLPQYNKLIFLLKEINGATLPRCNNILFQRLAGGFSLFVFQKRNKLLLIAALHTMKSYSMCNIYYFTLWKKREFYTLHYCHLQVTSHYCHLRVTLHYCHLRVTFHYFSTRIVLVMLRIILSSFSRSLSPLPPNASMINLLYCVEYFEWY